MIDNGYWECFTPLQLLVNNFEKKFKIPNINGKWSSSNLYNSNSFFFLEKINTGNTFMVNLESP